MTFFDRLVAFPFGDRHVVANALIFVGVLFLAISILLFLLSMGGCGSTGTIDLRDQIVEGEIGGACNPCQPDPEVPDANVPADNAR